MNGVEMFHNVCTNVVIHQDDPDLNWCVNYAKKGMDMVDPETCYVQALYVQSNLDYWMGDVAKATRTLLKEAIVQLKKEK